jgi:hypothetical protein
VFHCTAETHARLGTARRRKRKGEQATAAGIYIGDQRSNKKYHTGLDLASLGAVKDGGRNGKPVAWLAGNGEVNFWLAVNRY